MKKRLSALLLTAVLLMASMPEHIMAKGTLTVQTRNHSYTFSVGDTFTYSFWLELSPDLVNYSEAAIQKVLEYSGAATADGQNVSLDELKDMRLKLVVGHVTYDDELLSIQEINMPKLSASRWVKQKDLLKNIPGIESSVFDVTNSDMYFYDINVTDEESVVFQKKQILVSVKFKVISSSEDSMYLRTKLSLMKATSPIPGKPEETMTLTLQNKGQSTYIPYKTYETINSEEPTEVLNALVDDVGMDIRYYNLDGQLDQFLRPQAGVTVKLASMYSPTVLGKMNTYIKKTDGEKVTWFYDVDYGFYYCTCSLISDDGRYYATPNIEKAEVINVPATGEVQALWLVKADPEEVHQVTAHVQWEDSGHESERPPYMQISLKEEGSKVIANNFHTMTVETVDDDIVFDNVNIYTTDGEIAKYTIDVTFLEISQDQLKKLIGLGSYPYETEVTMTDGENLTLKIKYKEKSSEEEETTGEPSETDSDESTEEETDPEETYPWEIPVYTQETEPEDPFDDLQTSLKLDLTGIKNPGTTIWIDGKATEMSVKGSVDLYGSIRKTAVLYKYDKTDKNSVIAMPTEMYVWLLDFDGEKYNATRLYELDNFFAYYGNMYRFSYLQGIRFITGIDMKVRQKLIDADIGGYFLLQYGTLIAETDKLDNKSLTMQSPGAVWTWAYDFVTENDPIYGYDGNKLLYTNVLTDITIDDYLTNLTIRPYIKLQGAEDEIVIYGAEVRRTPASIAYQNRNTYSAGTEEYEAIWQIIRSAYGTAYDSEYKVKR